MKSSTIIAVLVMFLIVLYYMTASAKNVVAKINSDNQDLDGI